MKNIVLLSAGLTLGLTGSAFATGDETFNLGDFVFPAGDVQSEEVVVTLGPNPKGVIGFSVSFDYNKADSDGSWASDLQMVLTDPNGNVFDIGGLNDEDPLVNEWDFQGSGSTDPGFYEHTSDWDVWADDPRSKGDWTIALSDDWNSGSIDNEWNNFTITFHKIPAPGALALLGVAGVAGTRRRRRQ